VTVDPEAVTAGNRTVERLEALADAVAGYESDHGVILLAEMAAMERSDREHAVALRRAAELGSVGSESVPRQGEDVKPGN